MSKIICEVCGTSYPETSAQCPICGCVSPGDLQSFSDAQESSSSGGYTYVKGGRFSKSNVRKRNRGEEMTAVPAKRAPSRAKPAEKPAAKETTKEKPAQKNVEQQSNKGLIITIILLIIAILAVGAYICVKFLMPGLPSDNLPADEPGSNVGVEEQNQLVICTNILLDTNEVTLNEEGQTVSLHVNFLPANTTDTPSFSTNNPQVATVDQSGVITAVSRGEAVITISCGDANAECKVICDIIDPAALNFRLNRQQITFDMAGSSWLLYSGEIDLEEIQWWSDDEAVAVVNAGRVIAVDEGYTTIYAEFGGVTQSCEIVCAFESENNGQEGNGGVDEEGDNQPSSSGEYHLDNLFSSYDTEVTLAVGEWFPLQLVDSNGNKVNAEWSVENTNICTVNGGDVKAVGVGDTYVIATYNGQEYRCKVHVI